MPHNTAINEHFLFKRRWIFLTFAFGLLTLVVSAFLMYREIYRPKQPNSILATYGYLFREEVDMDRLDKIIQSQKQIPVEETKNHFKETCKVSCTKKKLVQTGRNNSQNYGDYEVEQFNDLVTERGNDTDSDDGPVAARLRDTPMIKYLYHGCCISYQKYTFPRSLDHAANDKKMRIVQFKRRKQAFLTDVCEQAKNCNRDCKCRQQMVTAVALVVDGEATDEDFDENKDQDYDEMNARIELVKYPGWCKCFNNI